MLQKADPNVSAISVSSLMFHREILFSWLRVRLRPLKIHVIEVPENCHKDELPTKFTRIKTYVYFQLSGLESLRSRSRCVISL